MDLQKLAQIGRIVEKERAFNQKSINLAKKSLEHLGANGAHFELLAKAVAGVRTSWRIPEPRPRGFAQWFFVRSYALHEPWGYKRVERCEKFWIKEFLDDPEAAEKSLAPNLLGTSGEIAKVICAKYGLPFTDALLVGRNERTVKSHFGEEWELSLYAFCQFCPAMTLICRHVDDHEFEFGNQQVGAL